jgi:uncharacterized protein
MKQFLWKLLGFISLGMAYIGVVTPGIPYSPFVVFAAYCFTKGSPKMHDWLYNHKLFGPFLSNWVQKRVFPLKLKFFMLLTMSSSLLIMWFSLHNIRAVTWTGGFMILVAIWAWRFPSTIKEYDSRIKQGKKIGWFNNYV